MKRGIFTLVFSMLFGVLLSAQTKPYVPATKAECNPTDIELLESIQKENPGITIISGDTPANWNKGFTISWIQGSDKKAYVKELVKVMGNTFKSLTLDGTKSFKELKSIRIQNSGLTKVVIKNQPMLSDVNFENNKITSFEMANLPLMDNVNLADNFLATFPFSAKEFPKLTSAKFTNNKITTITLDGFQNLNNITLFGNKSLQTATIQNCPKLTNIDIYRCKIDRLTLENLPLLKSLDVNENNLKSIDLTPFTVLKSFSGSLNKFAAFTDIKLPKLIEQITVVGGHDESGWVSVLEPTMKGELNVSGYPKLWAINVNKNMFTSVVIRDMAGLERLLIKENDLRTMDIKEVAEYMETDVSSNYLPLSELAKLKKVIYDAGDDFDYKSQQSFYVEKFVKDPVFDLTEFKDVKDLKIDVFYNFAKDKTGETYTMKDGKITFKKNGKFSFNMTSSDFPGLTSRSRTMTITKAETTGVNDIAAKQAISVNYNRTAKAININLKNSNNGTLELYNLSGQKVLSANIEQQNQEIAVSEQLPQGIYVVKVVSGTNTITQKIVL